MKKTALITCANKKAPWLEDKPEIRVFSDNEAYWLASAIDGEGSIGRYKFGHNNSRTVCIQMGNTNKKFVDRFREIIGCGSQIRRKKYDNTRKPMYFFSLRGNARGYKVLKQISQILIIKKKKCEKIIKELENKPFGRWIMKTEKARKRTSIRMRKIWRDRKNAK